MTVEPTGKEPYASYIPEGEQQLIVQGRYRDGEVFPDELNVLLVLQIERFRQNPTPAADTELRTRLQEIVTRWSDPTMPRPQALWWERLPGHKGITGLDTDQWWREVRWLHLGWGWCLAWPTGRGFRF